MEGEETFGGVGPAEAGRRSGESRRRRKLRREEMTPEERARDTIEGNLDALMKELTDAALGKGDFVDLKLETRVSTATRLVEWRLGRPAASKPPKEDPEGDTVPQDGDDLFE